MTVATDLATATGKRRRFYLRIAGQKTVFWQRNDEPHVDGSDVGADPPGAHPITPYSEFLFRCDELDASANLVDEVGRHTGTLATGTAATTTGQVNSRARNLASDRFDLVDGNLIAPATYTLALWYKTTVDDTQDRAIVIRDSNSTSDPAILLRINNGVVYYEGRFVGPTTFSISQGSILAGSGWHHFVCTFDGDTATLYHNGTASGTSTGHAGKTIDYDVTSTGAFSVGGDAATIFDFAQGHIDDIAFYSGKVYSAEWVRRCYNDAITFGRSGLNCLRLPEAHHSAGIDLGTMSTSLDAIDFVFDDIRDPAAPTTSYFGKLFAPGRWEATGNFYTTLRRPTATTTELEASATTLPVNDNSGFDTAGEAYILGSEAFSWTGKSTTTRGSETIDTLTGVTRGIWPALDDPRGTGDASFALALGYGAKDDSLEGDAGDNVVISEYPFGSLIGQMVALYVTTWDVTTRQWNAGSLVWCGRVGDTVRFIPRQSAWQMTARSIIGDLDRKLGGDMPAAYLYGFNLSTTDAAQLSFHVTEWDDTGADQGKAEITIAAGFYSSASFISAIVTELNDSASWSIAPNGLYHFSERYIGDGVWTLEVFAKYNYKYTLHPYRGAPSLILAALGVTGEDSFHGLSGVLTIVADAKLVGAVSAVGHIDSSRAYRSFHPLPFESNGNTMLVRLPEGGQTLWTDQGIGQAWVRAKGNSDDDPVMHFAYTAISDATIVYSNDAKRLSLTNLGTLSSEINFIGARQGEPDIAINQVYSLGSFTSTVVGPMKSLLYLLASTGTLQYNSVTYDISPADVAVGVPMSIIDAQSFLDADAYILGAYPQLSQYRHLYFVDDEAISWMELFLREAQTYGLALVWARSKLRVRRLFATDRANVTATLSDSNFAFPDEMPELQASTDTVINSRTFSLNWDHTDRKYMSVVTVVDRVSRQGLLQTKERKIEHPGLSLAPEAALIETLVKLTRNESEVLRFPWYTMSRSVAPTLYNVIAVGDIVTLTTSYALPDPMGTGSYATSTRALILNLRWNLQAGFGTVDLLVVHPDAFVPWAPSAEITAWDSGTRTLTVSAQTFGRSGDSNDAVAFEAGDEVKIFQRWTFSVADPPVAESGPYTGVVASVTATTIVLEVGHTVDFDGFMDTTKYRYAITFDDWGAVGVSQTSRGLWGADVADRYLGTSDRAKRWG